MKNSTDYLYYRELYSNQYYSKRGMIEVTLKNGGIKYVYFDKDKRIKLTEKRKFSSKFYRRPKNYEKYVEYLKQHFAVLSVNYVEEVVVISKY